VLSFLTISFSKCLIKTWTKFDVADSDSESKCSGIQNSKIKDIELEKERRKKPKQFILVPPTTHE